MNDSNCATRRPPEPVRTADVAAPWHPLCPHQPPAPQTPTAPAPPTPPEDGAAAPPPPAPPSRRTQVLYVRVTTEEKRRIVDRAHQSRMSVSRYLTRLALDGKAPPTVEERRRLEDLVALFKRTERGLRHLSAAAHEFKLFTSVPGVEEDFALAEQSISGLLRELSKRL